MTTSTATSKYRVNNNGGANETEGDGVFWAVETTEHGTHHKQRQGVRYSFPGYVPWSSWNGVWSTIEKLSDNGTHIVLRNKCPVRGVANDSNFPQRQGDSAERHCGQCQYSQVVSVEGQTGSISRNDLIA